MHAYTNRYTHTHTYIIYTQKYLYTLMWFPSSLRTHRVRADTYVKLVKLLKTPSGTLVSWFEDRARYLWAWQT